MNISLTNCQLWKLERHVESATLTQQNSHKNWKHFWFYRKIPLLMSERMSIKRIHVWSHFFQFIMDSSIMFWLVWPNLMTMFQLIIDSVCVLLIHPVTKMPLFLLGLTLLGDQRTWPCSHTQQRHTQDGPRLGLPRVLEYSSTTRVVNYSSNFLLLEYSLISISGCKFPNCIV